MKIAVIIFLSLIFGYLIGTFYPPRDFIAPVREVKFESDFEIKAGQKATSRYFGTSLEPIDLPVEITFSREHLPKLKLSGPGQER